MHSPEATLDMLERSAYRKGHVILNSGLHSDVKVEADRLLGYDKYYRPVMEDINELVDRLDVPLIVPVPNGARRLIRSRAWAMAAPYAYTRKPEKGIFTIDEFYIDIIKKLTRLAVFEDVVSTGKSPATMSHTIHKVNPDINIDLIAILRRGEVKPEHAAEFASQHYLVERSLPTWSADQCPYREEHATIEL